MKERQLSTFWAMLVLVTLVAAVPNFAAARNLFLHTESLPPECDQTADEECDDEAEAGPDGGPKTCVWAVGQPGGGLVQCLGEEICGEDADGDGFANDVVLGMEGGMTSMNFSLSESPGCTSAGGSPGPQEEISSFCLRENGDAIGYALLEVEQPNLLAKIHKFVENPGRSGEIRIGINDDMVVVDVGPAMQSVDRLNKMVCLALGRDFRMACLNDFFVVYADSLGRTPTLLILSTAQGSGASITYSGVSTTEIALEPKGGRADITACGEPSGPALLISPR